ncbi:MAG: shikimate kinase, partial [Acidobacteria bacterium]|nr:shikimate kinase [Acidobacteriota bacterium]
MHLKLKGAPLICLVGYMGCGKSTIGRLLAARLGWTFVDLDEEVERRSGLAIPVIFEQGGEKRFRELEHEALLEQLSLARRGRARVLALGGGAFVNPKNRHHMENDGISIWLDCPLARLRQRVEAESHRPLARDPEQFERLYQERLPYYRDADF